MTPAKIVEPKVAKSVPPIAKPAKAAPKAGLEKKTPAPKKAKAVNPSEAPVPVAPKPAARKAPAGDAAEKPKRAAAPKKAAEPAQAAPSQVSSELRERMISEMAYYLAERRGFCGGSAYDDWVTAESKIDQMLAGLPTE